MIRNSRTSLICMACVVALLKPVLSTGQTDTIDLKTCFDSAMINYPLARQQSLLEQTYDLKLNNLSAQWLPQFSLNGQANYNSDVTSITGNLPPGINIPKAPHDQYKLSLDVNQTLWDGGFRKKQAELEKMSSQAEMKQVGVDLYTLHDRINKVYFLMLILEENAVLNQTILSTLDEKLRTVGSGVRNGTFAPISEQLLLAEKLKTEQKIFEIRSDTESAREILAYLTGLKKDQLENLRKPTPLILSTKLEMNRPELDLFEIQMNKMELARDVTAVKNMPKVFAFGQLGYGKPGLNMLSDKWDSFWIVGAGLKWTLWDWHINQRDQKMLSIQKSMIQNQKDNFSLNLQVQSASEMSSIRKYTAAIQQDEKLLDLRKDILRTISSQFDNGLVSSSDYIQELNARLSAEIALQTDRLLLVQAQNNLLTILGKN
jgi:outer membrane protein TolC